jgi:hypothetical protein
LVQVELEVHPQRRVSPEVYQVLAQALIYYPHLVGERLPLQVTQVQLQVVVVEEEQQVRVPRGRLILQEVREEILQVPQDLQHLYVLVVQVVVVPQMRMLMVHMQNTEVVEVEVEQE